jgi:hypothetical protein
MNDPVTISLAMVGATAIKEGVKFLYDQAGDILKRWRERKDRSDCEQSEPMNLILPPVFEGQLHDPHVHFDVVAQMEPMLREQYRDLSEYASGIIPTRPGDPELMQKVESMRRSIEAILHQHVTFKGENRPASGTVLSGYVSVDSVAGEATGVEGIGPLAGDARGEVHAKKIEPGGKVVGVKWTR